MQTRRAPSLTILLWVTVINFAAQIPYYLHNYYFPYHVLPTPSSVLLLGVTLIWFLAGYVGTIKKSRFGYFALLSFVTVEVLFYLHTILFGAFIFQLQNPSVIIKTIFLIGYLSGFVSGFYAYAFIRYKIPIMKIS